MWLELCIDFLNQNGGAADEEGIFRVQGTETRKLEIERCIDSGGRLIWDENTTPGEKDLTVRIPHDTLVVGQIVKALIRDSAEPLLFPETLYARLIEIGKTEDVDVIKQRLKDVLADLPPRNIAVAKKLLPFLRRIADAESKTKMSARGLAVVFSPTLVRAANMDPLSEMQNMKFTIAIVRTLLENYEELIPS